MRDACKIVRCKKEIYAKGYCPYHYNKHGRPSKPCKEKNCTHNNYAKGLCHTHYEYYRREPTYREGKICSITGCRRKNRSTNKYCNYHRPRVEKGQPLTGDLRVGKNNYNWNGGTSEYPNHSTMKQIRRQKVEETKGHCEDCGKKQKIMHLHHMDKTKDNHEYDNFKFLCPKCHLGKYHKGSTSGPRHPYKGRDKYTKGYTPSKKK